MHTFSRDFSLLTRLRLSAFFLVALFLCLQIGLFFLLWERLSLKERQRAEWTSAESLAAKISPFLSPELDFPQLRTFFDEYLQDNLNRDVHLLDAQGEVLHSFSRHSSPRALDRLSLSPLQRFLSPEGRSAAPLLGPEPFTGEETALFSAAQIRLPADEPGYLYLNLDNRRARRIRESYLDRGVLIAAGLSSLLAAVASFLLGVLLFRPVRKRLLRFLEGIRAYSTGDMKVQLPVDQHDELGELEQTFNELLRNVNSSFEKLARKDALRRELVENIWHDIRGPVAALRTVAERLQRENDQSTTRETIESLLGNANHLSRFLVELQEVSELDLGERTPEIIPTDIIELADETVAALNPAASERQIDLRVVSEVDRCLVLIDPALIARLLRNLLENALRYSPKGSTVEIQVTPRESEVELAVADSGPGIAPQQLSQVFERDFRGDAGQASPESRGLGLAIVKKIAEAHGTPLELVSEPGHGARFSLVLRKYLPVLGLLLPLLFIVFSEFATADESLLTLHVAGFERSPVFDSEIWKHNFPKDIAPRLVAGDINGDGRDDLLAFQPSSGSLFLGYSKDDRSFAVQAFGTLPSGIHWADLRTIRLPGEMAARLLTPFGDAHAVWLSKLKFPLEWEHVEIQGDGGTLGPIVASSPAPHAKQLFVTPRPHADGSLGIGVIEPGRQLRLLDRLGYSMRFVGLLSTPDPTQAYPLFRDEAPGRRTRWGFYDAQQEWHLFFQSPVDLRWGMEEIMDINGDGVQELLLPGRNLQGTWVIFFYGREVIAVPNTSLGDRLRKQDIAATGDFAGSGRDAILLFHQESFEVLSPRRPPPLPDFSIRIANESLQTDTYGNVPLSTELRTIDSAALRRTVSAPGSLPFLRTQREARTRERALLIDTVSASEDARLFRTDASEAHGPFLCLGFQEGGGIGRSVRCPTGYAFLELDDGGSPLTGSCCKLPSPIMFSSREEAAQGRCPEGSMVVGIETSSASNEADLPEHHPSLRCRFLNSSEYSFGDASAGRLYGDSSSSTPDSPQLDRDRLPLAFRYGAGRIDLSAWDSDGCISADVNSVLVGISGPHCRDMLFAPIRQKSAQGSWQILPLLPECQRLADINDPSRGCVENEGQKTRRGGRL